MKHNEKLRALRGMRNYSRPFVAQAIGIHVNNIKYHEEGGEPNIETMSKYARFYETTEQILFFDHSDKLFP